MNDNTRNTYATYGLEILKRSVRLVLYDEAGDPLALTQIRDKLDRPEPFPTSRGNHDLIRGVLQSLMGDTTQRYVLDCGKGRWRITEKGVSLIEDG